MILHGDSLIVLKDLPDNSVDSVVTDPPYGLSFMGKKWDYDVPSTKLWREVLRVLKPGGHLLSFGGTRTYHRMVVAIEDAGFEIRDQIQWIYGSGFPKSLDVSKAMDKAANAEREVVGVKPGHKKFVGKTNSNNQQWDRPALNDPEWQRKYHEQTAPSTDLAKQWAGWGTALKPANEPIVLARKPLSESTVAKNVLKWGTGALNIDGSRIGTSDVTPSMTNQKIKGAAFKSDNSEKERDTTYIQNPQGRWPANVLFDEAAAEALDQQSGKFKSESSNTRKKPYDTNAMSGRLNLTGLEEVSYGDSGGASRFFYVAKASKRERNAGLEHEVKQKQGARPKSADSTGKFPDHDHRETGGNNHPTVKPIKLMEYLIKLINPPNGIVLDPFCGSGTTIVAAKGIGFDVIGIEREIEYVAIAEKRLEKA